MVESIVTGLIIIQAVIAITSFAVAVYHNVRNHG